ncbi:MAG TPA: kelch repeat-containing protein, partial [Ignavibacteriales bacterium]|nr:kelch repeat-containing protein [Ignavibacteriales bacterium]
LNVAFKEHYINGHGVGIDDVTLGHKDYDITALSANMDDWAFVGDTAKPAARFKNAGYASASFDAVAEIESLGYSSRKTFTNVAHDSVVEVVFDGLVPAAAGAFDIKIYADIAADENMGDNELAGTLNVAERLTPAAWHLETPIPAGYAVHGSFPYTKKSSDPAKPDTTFLYVMGGYRAPNTSQDSIYKYNTLSKEWTYLGKSGLLASDIIALQVKGKAYMAGGYIGSDNSSSLLIYDIEADSFMTGKSMPNPVRSYAAASYGDSLVYIFGGLKDNSSYQFTSDVLVYNIHTDEWAPATMLPDDYLMGVSAVIAGNKIVLTGSYETYTAVSNKVYFGEINPADPYTIHWSSERRPCLGIIFAAAGAWYGKEKSYAFFVGGQTTESQYNMFLWVYDMNNKKWLKGPDQPALSLYAPTVSPVVRNDSVYMVLPGGMNLTDSYNTNQWLYIGKDKPLNYSSKDLAAVSINAADTVYANNELIFKASFTNKQLAAQTFDAVMEITPGSYKKSAAVSALGYLGVKEISFPAWKPDTTGTYTVKVYAAVNGDEDAGNDTLTSTVVVRNTIGIDDEGMTPAVYSLSLSTLARLPPPIFYKSRALSPLRHRMFERQAACS